MFIRSRFESEIKIEIEITLARGLAEADVALELSEPDGAQGQCLLLSQDAKVFAILLGGGLGSSLRASDCKKRGYGEVTYENVQKLPAATSAAQPAACRNHVIGFAVVGPGWGSCCDFHVRMPPYLIPSITAAQAKPAISASERPLPNAYKFCH